MEALLLCQTVVRMVDESEVDSVTEGLGYFGNHSTKRPESTMATTLRTSTVSFVDRLATRYLPVYMEPNA